MSDLVFLTTPPAAIRGVDLGGHVEARAMPRGR